MDPNIFKFFLMLSKYFLEEKWKKNTDYPIMFIWEIFVPYFWLFWIP